MAADGRHATRLRSALNAERPVEVGEHDLRIILAEVTELRDIARCAMREGERSALRAEALEARIAELEAELDPC